MAQAVQRHPVVAVVAVVVALAQQVRLHSKMEALTHLVALVDLVHYLPSLDHQLPTQVVAVVELMVLLLKPAVALGVVVQGVLVQDHLKMAPQI
jgi:hypothetical protein